GTDTFFAEMCRLLAPFRTIKHPNPRGKGVCAPSRYETRPVQIFAGKALTLFSFSPNRCNYSFLLPCDQKPWLALYGWQSGLPIPAPRHLARASWSQPLIQPRPGEGLNGPVGGLNRAFR